MNQVFQRYKNVTVIHVTQMKFLTSPVWLINKGGSILRGSKITQPTQRHRDSHDKHALQWDCSFLDSFAEEYESSVWEVWNGPCANQNEPLLMPGFKGSCSDFALFYVSVPYLSDLTKPEAKAWKDANEMK